MDFTRRMFSQLSPEMAIEWRKVDVRVVDHKTGRVIFEQADVEVPASWSDNAAQILASKYFRRAGVPLDGFYKIDEPGIPDWLLRRESAMGSRLGSETSARQVFDRLAGCWTYWGWRIGVFGKTNTEEGYRQAEENAKAFFDEVRMMLAMQIGAPNSPQFFNTGLYWAYGIEGPDAGQWAFSSIDDIQAELRSVEPIDGNAIVFQTGSSYVRPQPHACFLTSVADDLVNPGGIMDTWVREAAIFKGGSGSGTNVSCWRAKGEKLSGGGVASGVMSWLKIGDAAAGAIASGGTTRRAAVMRILNADHPEIFEFVNWKLEEETKAAAMHVGSQAFRNYYLDIGDPRRDPFIAVPEPVVDRMAHGFEPKIYDVGWEGDAINTVGGQNSNNAVRVTDDFMRLVERVDLDCEWPLKARTTGETMQTVRAGDLWADICRATWASGDPSLQYHDAINAWNTCPADGDIVTANPCFTGDTKVWTIHGAIPFSELAAEGKPVQVLTELPDGKLAYRLMAHPRLTRRSARVYEVTLKANRGKKGNVFTKVRVTPEHVFFMRDGTKKQVRDLLVGDRIESVYRGLGSHTKFGLRATSGDTVLESYVIYEMACGRRPNYPEEHLGHINGDPNDNSPDNLELRPGTQFNSERMKGKNNPMRRWYKSLTEEEKKQYCAKLAQPGERNPNFGNKGHLAKYRWINNGQRCRRIPQTGVVPEGWQCGYMRRPESADSISPNHVVVSVKPIGIPEPVYCGTVAETGRFFVALGDDEASMDGILVSNCGEFNFLDGSACDLASVRLTAFLREDGSFDLEAYSYACRLWTIILDISVSMAGFPGKEFAVAAYNYRTIGLGYADLGGLLMRMALPYDSDEGRNVAAGLTAVMHFSAMLASSEMARELGPFPRWHANAEHMRRVYDKHVEALADIMGGQLAGQCVVAAMQLNNRIMLDAGFRNAQFTLLAPTGTISFVLDCDTTGIEPEFALVLEKQLAGGSSMQIVNQAVPAALWKLGYDTREIDAICSHLKKIGFWPTNSEGLPCLLPDHMQIFACAGEIDPIAHIKMMAVAQPFLSGAISKTVNLPFESTPEDISNIYLEAWRLGLKSVAPYRDGSKLTQPHRAVRAEADVADSSERPKDELPVPPAKANSNGDATVYQGRERLPWRRENCWTQKVKIDGNSVFLRVSEYEDGRPGEIFLDIAPEGSTLRSMANCLAIAISLGLQHRVPLQEYVDAFVHWKFEPAGIVEGHDYIRMTSSIIDFVARELGITYLGRDDLANTPNGNGGAGGAISLAQPPSFTPPDYKNTPSPALSASHIHWAVGEVLAVNNGQAGKMTGESCPSCHALLRMVGTCRYCRNCNWHTGCG